jgi:hypothetical protein
MVTLTRAAAACSPASRSKARLRLDSHANEAFYKMRGFQPQDVTTRRFAVVPAVETLKAELNGLSGQSVEIPVVPMVPPAVFVPR